MSKALFNSAGNANLGAAAMQNLFVNGFMDFVTESQGAAQTASASYPADMFYLSTNLSASVVLVANPFPTLPYIRHGLQYTVTAAKATLVGTDWSGISQTLEGIRGWRLRYGTTAAQPSMIGFVFQSSVAGTYSLCLRNPSATRTFVAPFTVAANTPTFVKILVPPDFTNGTTAWEFNTTSGSIQAFIIMGAGPTNLQSNVNQWTSSNILAASTQTNLHATNGAVVRMSGLVWLVGNELPPEEMWGYAQRSYEDEHALVNRYVQRVMWHSRFYAQLAGMVSWHTVNFPTMRATPTVTFISRANIGAATSSVTLAPRDPNSALAQIISTGAGEVFVENQVDLLVARM